MSSFRRSEPNSDFFHQTLNRIDSELIPQFLGGTEPKVKNQFRKTLVMRRRRKVSALYTFEEQDGEFEISGAATLKLRAPNEV